MDFEQTVGFVLTRSAAAHRNALERKLRSTGLHSGQVFLLFELWKVDGQRQVDLAAGLRLTPPTVNKLLGGLIENDFVTRARYEDDARSTRIFLTQKGKDIRPVIEQLWQELEEDALIELTDTESLMLRQLLRKTLERPEDLLR